MTKPIDGLLSKPCACCIDKGTDPKWDKDPWTRYVCGERESLTGSTPCTVEDAKKCTI